MTSLNPTNIAKHIEQSHPYSLPEASPDDIANGLKSTIALSASTPNVSEHIHASITGLPLPSWAQKLIPGLDRLAAEHHYGNYVIVRGQTEPFFESMPLYVRLGMHLLFYGKAQRRVLSNQLVEDLLRELSIKEGAIYDSPKSASSIPSFVKTYKIQLDELREPDINKYKTFNEFFFRKLREGTRPVQNEEDPSVICSAADCRLVVYASVGIAKEFWVKGKNFNIPNLLHLSPSSPRIDPFHDASIAIFRLAPSDYHRFHSPIDCITGDREHVPGQYYTVNPEAVNEPGFHVLTANTRSILYLTHAGTGLPVAFVAIGALLVGSIIWTGGREKGTKLRRGDELGHFAYGGSTIVVVFPKGVIEFDKDLLSNSEKPIETLVKVGYSIGKTPRISGEDADTQLGCLPLSLSRRISAMISAMSPK